MSARLQNVLLIVLALATAAAIVVALGSAGSVESRSAPLPDSDALATGRQSPTSTEGDEAAETTSEPEEPEETDLTLADAIAGAGGEAVSVLVLGDDTSNTRSEWVHVWGVLAAEERPVTVVHWDEAGDVSFTDPDVLSESGDGSELTIWSASRTGADVAVTTERLDELLPEDDIDAVMINLGVNDEADEVADDLDALLEGIRDEVGDVPVGVVRQGPYGGSSEVTGAIDTWTDDNDVTVLDASGRLTPESWAQAVVDQMS